jgi:hypothetical protein
MHHNALHHLLAPLGTATALCLAATALSLYFAS